MRGCALVSPWSHFKSALSPNSETRLDGCVVGRAESSMIRTPSLRGAWHPTCLFIRRLSIGRVPIVRESLAIYAKYPAPFCVMCIAVDNLAKVRERYGRAAVDAAMRVAAQTIQNGIRPSDHVGQWNDNELLAILLECMKTKSASLASEFVSWFTAIKSVGGRHSSRDRFSGRHERTQQLIPWNR